MLETTILWRRQVPKPSCLVAEKDLDSNNAALQKQNQLQILFQYAIPDVMVESNTPPPPSRCKHGKRNRPWIHDRNVLAPNFAAQQSLVDNNDCNNTSVPNRSRECWTIPKHGRCSSSSNDSSSRVCRLGSHGCTRHHGRMHSSKRLQTAFGFCLFLLAQSHWACGQNVSEAAESDADSNNSTPPFPTLRPSSSTLVPSTMAPSVEIIGSTIANASLTAPPTSELVVDTSNNNTATLAPTNKDTSTNATTTTADPQSLAPTISTSPTFTPTSSAPPSAFPSSAYPTLTVVSTDRGIFRQDFVFANTTFFNESQQRALMSIFNSYTPLFAPQSNLTQRVATECTFDEQRVSVDDANKTINTVDYSCQYTSTSVNVTGFPALFYTHVGENLSELRDDMEDVGIDIVNARGLEIYQILSPAPSQSPQPSQPPTLTPTTSARPTTTPSFGPSSLPTTQPLPTTPPMFLSLPSAGPMTSVLPEGERLAVGAIAAIVILAGLTFLLLLFLYYRSWSRKREEQEMSSGGTMGGGGGVGGSSSNGGGGGTGRLPQTEASMSGLGAASSNASTIFTPRLRGSNRPGQQQHQQQQQHPLYHGAGGMGRKASSADSASLGGAASSSMPAPTVHNNPNGAASDAILDDQRENVMLSPTDSLLSNQSLLSMGDSGLADGSGEENDGTKNLQDEFDQYKDENLEQLREHVEGNLSGFEGIMSAAVTNALMGDEEANVNMQDLLWGCSAKAPGTEIEASALFEVSDWLKRNESAGGDRKRAFMQEILNKMVTSVRHGVIVAEDASRTIHESAAILGLQLAEELPMTTVIISGMRKMTTAEDMQRALHEFGDIDEAAVASGKRGFGIVRFRRRKSVDQALQRYKSGEIVILDVSIQMKVIMPSGVVESR